ncbi:MAG: hypothetical protein AB7S69_15370 [Salinivirgaceae bacterium]
MRIGFKAMRIGLKAMRIGWEICSYKIKRNTLGDSGPLLWFSSLIAWVAPGEGSKEKNLPALGRHKAKRKHNINRS